MFVHGTLEQRLYGEEMVKKLRLERLKELREQERVLGKEQNRQYRAAINERKQKKRNHMREQKVALMKATHDDLANKWRLSLINNGSAHRDAIANAVSTIERIEEKENVMKQKAVATAARGKIALKEAAVEIKHKKAKTENLKKQREAVKELQASNREDARMAAETREAKAKATALKAFEDEFAGGPVIIKQGSAGQSSASAKGMQSVGVAVHAKVMKHGATRADISVVKNDAVHEEGEALKRKYDRVLRQLINKMRAKHRARQAMKTEKMAAKVDLLDNELQILQVMDRSGPRMKRVKSTSQVEPATESAAVAQAFENIFLGGGEDSVSESSEESISDFESESSADGEDGTQLTHKVAVGLAATDKAREGPIPGPHKREKKDSAPKARKTVPVPTSPGVRSPSKPESPGPVAQTRTSPREIKSSIPKQTTGPAKSKTKARNKGEPEFGGGSSRPKVDVDIITAEEREASDTAFLSQQSLDAKWMVTGLGRGDLSENSSVNFDEYAGESLEDALAVTQGDVMTTLGLGELGLGGEGGEGAPTNEDLLARYLVEASAQLPPEGAEDVEVTRRSATPLQLAILEDGGRDPSLGEPPRTSKAKQMALRESSDRLLRLSLSECSEEDEKDDYEEGQSVYNSEVDASWVVDEAAGDEALSHGSTASTVSARHDTLEGTTMDGEESEDSEEEKDDLNVSAEDAEEQGSGLDMDAYHRELEGEWERLGATAIPSSFANEWMSELQDQNDEEEQHELDSEEGVKDVGGGGLTVRLQGSGARSSISFESLFIEEEEDDEDDKEVGSEDEDEDEDEDDDEDEDGGDDMPKLHHRLPERETEDFAALEAAVSHVSDKSGSHSMDLSDFVNKYGDLSLSSRSVSGAYDPEGGAEAISSAEDSMSVSVQANQTQLNATSSSAGSDSTDGADTTVHSLRELLGFQDSHEYEAYLKSKVSRGTSAARRFPTLHGVPMSDDGLDYSRSDDGSPSPVRPDRATRESVSRPQLQMKSPMAALRASLSSLGGKLKSEGLEAPPAAAAGARSNDEELSRLLAGNLDVSADSSDDEEADQLIQEIDAMKQRLLGSVRGLPQSAEGLEVRGSPRAAASAAAGESTLRMSLDSTTSTDSSLSYHPIDEGLKSGSGSAAGSLSASGGWDADSLGSGRLSRTSRASEGSNMLQQLDSALSRALAANGSASAVAESHDLDVEELVEQYLSSMSASTGFLSAHSLDDTRSSGTATGSVLSGGNVSSMDAESGPHSLHTALSTEDDSLEEGDIASV